ncbi:hypothetical protein ACFFJY_04975 [Fictibacillus aquaticus]|uniref:Uncharacterized protein n=1 Tax=Fictibacillus aquaticus TaxID=2021314 RepID=A0A235F4H6_9BACL|nr:hypothetical protein [Fictibacillus aquaticus]OYD56104.1 hypothetical protein CGZ90_19290 [Fictibacillus aquaticus]
MNKKIIFTFGILFLTACGKNEEGLDEKKTHDAVAKRALEQKVIKDGGYKANDIQLVKACEAIENGETEFKGNYIVSWKTKDDKYDRTFLLKDYKATNGDTNFKETKDKCLDF